VQERSRRIEDILYLSSLTAPNLQYTVIIIPRSRDNTQDTQTLQERTHHVLCCIFQIQVQHIEVLVVILVVAIESLEEFV
jgi:hypothetical protein